MKSKLLFGTSLTLVVLIIYLFLKVYNCSLEKKILETEHKYLLHKNRFIQNEFELKERILGKKLLLDNDTLLFSILIVKGNNINEFSYTKTLEFYNSKKGIGKFKNSILCAVINENELSNYYDSGKAKYKNIHLVIDSNSTITKQLNISLNDFAIILLNENNICTYLYIVSEAENNLENYLNENIIKNILANGSKNE